jgi:hypothetical protein
MTNATVTSSRLLRPYPGWGHTLWAEFDLPSDPEEEDFDDDEEEDDDSDRLALDVEWR